VIVCFYVSKVSFNERGQQMSKVKFPKLGVDLRAKGQKDGPLTVDEMKSLLGWQEEPDEKDWGDEYLFKDMNKKKVRLTHNKTNRPFRMTLARRYGSEILRGKWKLNGEPFIFDRFGMTQDGQHRGVGFVLAEQERQLDPSYWSEIYGQRGPLTIDALIVTGISEKAEVVDTLGLGQKRSLGDVLFRRKEFAGIGERDQKRLANVLGGALRLVWLRTGGKLVTDAPWFPHSEALDFLQEHPDITKAVETVFRLENGSGADGKRISGKLSLAYSAGLFYLMGTAKTDPDRFEETGKIDRGLWAKAKEFWAQFADPDALPKGSPIMTLRNTLDRLDASGGQGRDEIIGCCVKAMNAFLDGIKTPSVKDIRPRRVKNKQTGKIELGETPRLGGLDRTPPEPEEEPEAEPVEKGKATGRKNSATDGWRVNDVAWVDDPDGEHWLGTINEFSEDKTVATLTAKEDGKQYETPVKSLAVDKPGEDD
jgi:hypothetical protein